MESIMVRYLGGESELLPNCDTVGTIMLRIASKNQRFASDVVVFPLGTDKALTRDGIPPPKVSVILKKECPQLDESECKINITLHAGAGDVSTVAHALDMLRIAAPRTQWPECALIDAARERERETVVRTMVQAGVDGTLALGYFSKDGDTSAVQRLLSAGVSANAVTLHDEVALTLASLYGHKAVVETLLAAGAHVNHLDSVSESALMCAAKLGREDVVETLLSAGAHVSPVNHNGHDALAIASRGSHKAVEAMLLSAGAAYP
eukprot:GEMP01044566.1.p1 GENE.GEMP01044566.1~~GEMP01044566.1.p1  ORF type:complete len:264 (+),score=59.14 GEMP01044566.1:249-1040(+)